MQDIRQNARLSLETAHLSRQPKNIDATTTNPGVQIISLAGSRGLNWNGQRGRFVRQVVPCLASAQDLLHNVARNVRQAKLAALEQICELLVIDAQDI